MSEKEARIGSREDITANIEIARHYARGLIFTIPEKGETRALYIPAERNAEGNEWWTFECSLDDSEDSVVDFTEINAADSLVHVVSIDEHGLTFEIGKVAEGRTWQPGSFEAWRIYYSDAAEGLCTGFPVRKGIEQERVESIC